MRHPVSDPRRGLRPAGLLVVLHHEVKAVPHPAYRPVKTVPHPEYRRVRVVRHLAYSQAPAARHLRG